MNPTPLPSRVRIRFAAICAGTAPLLAGLLLLLQGCGGEEEVVEDTGPPIAVRELQFGAGVVLAERQVGKLEHVGKHSTLLVYRRENEDEKSPVAEHRLYFVEGKLAQVEVLYDVSKVHKMVGMSRFFETVEKKYDVQEDFGIQTGRRRWINLDSGVALVWRDPVRDDIGTLTITWEEMAAQVAELRNQFDSPTAPQAKPKPPKIDLGL